MLHLQNTLNLLEYVFFLLATYSFRKHKKYLKILKEDFLESKFNLLSIIIELKLFYYFFQRPLYNIKLKKQISSYLDNSFFLRKTYLFLKNEGGMFKTHVYVFCNKISKLKN